jgi:hypothetical protein
VIGFTGNVPQKRGNYRNTIPGLKWCPHCTTFKRLTEFGLDQSRDGGLSGWCRKCRAAESKRRRDRDLTRSHDEWNARYRNDPQRFKCHVSVARAVAVGKLVKPKLCPVCCIEGRRIEAHHHAGYARENWLNVVWRCRQCHTLEHKRGPAIQAGAA